MQHTDDETMANPKVVDKQAKKQIDDGNDSEFLQAKIETAAFYAEQLLPQVSGLLPATVSGAESLYAIKPERLRG